MTWGSLEIGCLTSGEWQTHWIETYTSDRTCRFSLQGWPRDWGPYALKLTHTCFCQTKKNVACFLPGNSPASEFYMPTFWNTVCLFHLHRQVPTCLWRWNRQSVPKCRHIKFRCLGITRKKTYNIQNMVKVWNHQKNVFVFSICYMFWSYWSSSGI